MTTYRSMFIAVRGRIYHFLCIRSNGVFLASIIRNVSWHVSTSCDLPVLRRLDVYGLSYAESISTQLFSWPFFSFRRGAWMGPPCVVCRELAFIVHGLLFSQVPLTRFLARFSQLLRLCYVVQMYHVSFLLAMHRVWHILYFAYCTDWVCIFCSR